MDKWDLASDALSAQRLNATSTRVYKWAIARNFVSLEEITDVLGLAGSEAREALGTLVAARLMEERSGPGASEPPEDAAAPAPERRWRALNPQIAAARLAATESRLRQLMVDLSSARQNFEQLSDVYSILGSGGGNRKAIEIVGALADVVSLIDEASAGCKDEMISSQPGGGRPPEQLEQAVVRDIEMLDRGVKMRTLYQHASRHHTATRAYVDKVTAAGAEVRTSTELFGRMIVFDRAVAFLPHHTVPGGAAVIRDPSVISFLCTAFNHAWERATPVENYRLEPAVLSDLHRSVLRLLSEGARDETMARRLGVSLRTCRKYVAEIFDELGAESRFQAGYLAAERGLLT
ncbi:helix-turn-helix transcriptional regulator [Streptomyces marincola]|nr:helix-turn-helix transcriptional regulator [Streptomyces marincola]